ncbi:flagellar protein FliT [Paenibacillus wynnii]|uniref:flagellar protein FliT n=1 Tax=Paenibacillus wynnii TaxID=268407 RepID=UPI0027D84FE7|nr:flagellar protein FliT [Paenibacillus wynnii]
MDDLIQQLNQLTSSIIDRLGEVSYEEFSAFVEERQKLVDSIGVEVELCQPTPAQKQAISRIMEHDSAILARMNALRLEAQDWLQKRNQAKAQRSAYESGYTPDSILMDRKK